jgi:LysR family glycine cleavage system transcriptional activator
MRRLPSLNGLRAFEAAARLLSFTRAARELNVTQAAVSHQIKALEEQLGVPLFRRLNRALMLTDEGQLLLPAAREAFDRLAAAIDGLSARHTGGPLTVSVMPSFAAKRLVPHINRFLDRHPDIDLRISASERLVDFARDGIDVGIRFGGGAWPGLHAEWIAEETVTPVCSPALLPRLREPGDLAGMTLLHEEMLPLARFPTWRTWLTAAGLHDIDASRGPRFSHTHMLLQAAVDGSGVALGQTLLALDDLVAGRLVKPFDLSLPTNYAYYLVCLPATVDRPKVQAFRQWVREELADHRSQLANPSAPSLR